MLKVLLIDDESIVRQGLRQAIDWDSLDLTVVGEADSVPSAMNLACSFQPDIFLCDIRLPGADGFTFIDQVKKILPHAQIIILSGYGDQAYMLNAIHHGVCAYLLKPSSVSEITDALKKASHNLYEQRNKELNYQKSSQFLSENTDTLKMHFFDKLLTQNMSLNQLTSYTTSLGLKFNGPFYLLILTKHPSSHSMWNYMNQLAFSLRNYNPILSPLPRNDLMAVILSLPSACLPASLAQTCRIPSLSEDQSPLCITPPCKTPLVFSQYFDKMENFIRRSMWFNPGEIYSIDALTLPPFPQKQLQELENTFILALKNEEGTASHKAFLQIMNMMEFNKAENSKFQEEASYLLRIACTIRNVKEPVPFNIPLNTDKVKQLFLKYLGDFSKLSARTPGK